ncbi:MAG: hypothetical protein ACRDOL_42915 [Streptosporangiaceae bacterium]
MADFVNPYTFVPLPAVIGREHPGGHHCAGERNVSGAMTVQWSLQTPALLPQAHLPVRAGRVIVPGSSVKGAVRSVHETLLGSGPHAHARAGAAWADRAPSGGLGPAGRRGGSSSHADTTACGAASGTGESRGPASGTSHRDGMPAA